jgi:hypothetical protein
LSTVLFPPLLFVLQELEQLAEEAGLKAMLWSMQKEMKELSEGWMTGRLFELDVTEMQAQVCSHGAQDCQNMWKSLLRGLIVVEGSRAPGGHMSAT